MRQREAVDAAGVTNGRHPAFVSSAEASAGFSAASASKTVVRARSRRKWPAERLHLPKIPTLMRLPPAKCRAELRHLGWPVASARCHEFRRTALSLKSDVGWSLCILPNPVALIGLVTMCAGTFSRRSRTGDRKRDVGGK